MTVRLDWRGDRVADQVLDASHDAMDDVLGRAALSAAENHPGWKDRSGVASRSIVAERTRYERGRLVGRIGSTLARFIWLEVGARGRSGDHTLRRASDVEFAHLAERIRQRLGFAR